MNTVAPAVAADFSPPKSDRSHSKVLGIFLTTLVYFTAAIQLTQRPRKLLHKKAVSSILLTQLYLIIQDSCTYSVNHRKAALIISCLGTRLIVSGALKEPTRLSCSYNQAKRQPANTLRSVLTKHNEDI